MKRKNDIAIGARFMEELYRLFPEKSYRDLGKIFGCSPAIFGEWQKGVTPSAASLARIMELGGDIEYILTGRRKRTEPAPDFLAENEEEYS